MGETGILILVAPVLQASVPLVQPVAVRLVAVPAQIIGLAGVIAKSGTIPSSTIIGQQPLAGQLVLAVVVKL